MRFNLDLNKIIKPAVKLVLLSLFLGACKTQQANTSTTLGENSIKVADGINGKACVINPSEFTWPDRPGALVFGNGNGMKYDTNPPREDRQWMSDIIDAATALGRKKCGCTLNALAFVRRTNAFKYMVNNTPTFVPSPDDLKDLKGVVFNADITSAQNGSGDVGHSTVFIYLFKEGSFTWKGQRGTEFWQFNEYQDKTIKDGASVQFGPVENCPSVRS